MWWAFFYPKNEMYIYFCLSFANHGVLASISQDEINSMSQNIRWSMEQNSSSGNPVTRTRYGYRKEIDGPNHKWIIFEPEARRVRFAFLKAEEGWDYREIAEGLAAMEEAEMTGVKWTRTRLARLLSNEAYIGHILTNKRVKLDYMQRFSMTNHGQRPQYYIEDHHAPIIDREQFERVGERVRNGKLRSKQRKGERKGGASYDS